MPLFIEQSGDPQIPPPYSFPNVTIYSFRLLADVKALSSLCDARLNIGDPAQRGFEYRPILPYVDVEILHYPRMTSDDPRFDWGYSTQHELYFRLFVGKYEYRGGVTVPTEASVYIPYIFVDNAWSVVTGRDVVGLPKVMASFSFPGTQQQDKSMYPIAVATDVFPQFRSNGAQALCPVIEIDHNQAGPGFDDLQSGIIWPWGVYDPKKVDPRLLPFLENPRVFSTVQLKQIRDAQEPAWASYQALVHAEFGVGRIEPPKALPAAEMTLPRYDSLRIADELGLGGGVLQPLWQYTVNCDLKYGNVQNLFVNL